MSDETGTISSNPHIGATLDTEHMARTGEIREDCAAVAARLRKSVYYATPTTLLHEAATLLLKVSSERDALRAVADAAREAVAGPWGDADLCALRTALEKLDGK